MPDYRKLPLNVALIAPDLLPLLDSCSGPGPNSAVFLSLVLTRVLLHSAILRLSSCSSTHFVCRLLSLSPARRNEGLSIQSPLTITLSQRGLSFEESALFFSYPPVCSFSHENAARPGFGRQTLPSPILRILSISVLYPMIITWSYFYRFVSCD